MWDFLTHTWTIPNSVDPNISNRKIDQDISDVKLGMQRSFDRRNNCSVVEYISVLVSRIRWSGLECKRSGLGVRKGKKFFILENVHPPHIFIEKRCPPKRFLFRKRAPHTFSIQKTYPLYVFYSENVYPHDVFFLHFFDSPIRRDSWTAAPAMILLQLHASALTINHASAHYY